MCIPFCIENVSSCANAFASNVSTATTHLRQSIYNFFEGYRPALAKFLEKVQKTVLPILGFLGTGILFASQSSMFAIGFLVSIINPTLIEGTTKRISAIWSKQHVFTRCAIVIGAAVSWPISLAATAFFVGGNIGLSLLPVESQNKIITM